MGRCLGGLAWRSRRAEDWILRVAGGTREDETVRCSRRRWHRRGEVAQSHEGGSEGERREEKKKKERKRKKEKKKIAGPMFGGRREGH